MEPSDSPAANSGEEEDHTTFKNFAPDWKANPYAYQEMVYYSGSNSTSQMKTKGLCINMGRNCDVDVIFNENCQRSQLAGLGGEGVVECLLFFIFLFFLLNC